MVRERREYDSPPLREPLYNYYREFAFKYGHPPSLAQAGQALGTSNTNIDYHIRKDERFRQCACGCHRWVAQPPIPRESSRTVAAVV